MARDPVRDHRIELANRLREADEEYYLTMWSGVKHAALIMIPVTPEIQTYRCNDSIFEGSIKRKLAMYFYFCSVM
jgi:acetyl esterase/lipase